MINILVAENDGNGFLVRFDRAEKPIFMLATSAFKQVVGRESREFDEQDKVWLIEETAKAALERFLVGASAWLQANVQRVAKTDLKSVNKGNSDGFDVMFDFAQSPF